MVNCRLANPRSNLRILHERSRRDGLPNRWCVASWRRSSRINTWVVWRKWKHTTVVLPQSHRKVFLGDGHLSNWAIQEQHFSRYTAVVDLLHTLSYVYHAALESTPDMESCWQRCKQWITWVWQGEVRRAIAELSTLIESASEGQSRETLQESLTYLSNNAKRMRYDEYRQAGLPITTTIIESTIKQINRRMKGTEKFWRPGAEPQLQLCADRISETNPLTQFWQQREAQQHGYRKSRAKP